MKVFISGKISGLNWNDVVEKFQRSEDLLNGYEVINPTKLLNPDMQKNMTGTEFHKYCMLLCIDELLGCDTIYMQKDWRYSHGARIEHCIAVEYEFKIIYEERKKLTLSQIEDIVCDYFEFDKLFLHTQSRSAAPVKYRQIIMYFAYKKYTNKYIGKYFNRDHATTIYCVHQVNNLYDTEANYRKEIDELRRLIE